jgi:glycosyltransferase involved in cell wall biosynthesis
MKVLLNCNLPFSLAHGGQQIQIERTQAGLLANGVEAEPLRWWDDRQTGDIIHYFGRMPAGQIHLARQKGIRVVMAELLTGPGSRTPAQLRVQKWISRAIKRLAPGSFAAPFNWDAYPQADACVALTPWEAKLMVYLFNAPPDRVHVVANGVEEAFLQSTPAPRGPWLICTATITERKRVLELAQAAVLARTPVWIIGRAYAETDPYARAFIDLARQQPDVIRYEGGLNDRVRLAEIYRAARGFVLLSTMESLSLSALEAAACECPLLLSDLPWARCTFATNAQYCPVNQSAAATAKVLRAFYDTAPTLPPTPKPAGWNQIGRELKAVYAAVLQHPAK